MCQWICQAFLVGSFSPTRLKNICDRQIGSLPQGSIAPISHLGHGINRRLWSALRLCGCVKSSWWFFATHLKTIICPGSSEKKCVKPPPRFREQHPRVKDLAWWNWFFFINHEKKVLLFNLTAIINHHQYFFSREGLAALGMGKVSLDSCVTRASLWKEVCQTLSSWVSNSLDFQCQGHRRLSEGCEETHGGAPPWKPCGDICGITTRKGTPQKWHPQVN